MVELHASAEAVADLAETGTALLAVADAVLALAAGAAVGAEVGVDLLKGGRSQNRQKGIEA